MKSRLERGDEINIHGKKYDIIVVGAGPAGTTTARTAAEEDVSVLVLEKKCDIGVPVRCAEGVSEQGLKSVIEVEDSWIAQTISKSKFVAPDGTEIYSYAVPKGLILHRKIFDMALADKAVKAGAEIVTKAYVSGVIKEENRINGVKVEIGGKEKEIKSSIVIGADGIESQMGKWAGINVFNDETDVIPCFQMLLSNIDIDPECVEFYLGEEIAPGGYLWVFPKGDGIANVGVGINSCKAGSRNAFEILKYFVEKKYPQSSCLAMTAGGVISSPSPRNIVGNGFMLVGDAAFQINPLTGGGIINAMIAAKIAGKVAAEAVKENILSAEKLSTYQKEWHKVEGKKNNKSYNIKKVVSKFSDKEFNKIAQLLQSIPPEKRNVYKIFKKALFKHPKLIYDAAKVFGI